MNSRDAVLKALTPGDMFNPKNLIFRSVRTLAQFADCTVQEILDLLDEHFQGAVQVKPNHKHPQRGLLVALVAHIPQPPPAAPEEGEPDDGPADPQAVEIALEALQDAIVNEALPAAVAMNADGVVEIEILDEEVEVAANQQEAAVEAIVHAEQLGDLGAIEANPGAAEDDEPDMFGENDEAEEIAYENEPA